MTPPIQRDERLWLIAVHSDACEFVHECGIVESCKLLKEPNDACTLENCPRKLMVGMHLLEQVMI
jgi:hypothetical protein